MAKHTTAQAPRLDLSKLTNVPNVRDLNEALPRVKPGRILRCANPAEATEEDTRLLTEVLGVRELVDLRAGEEIREDGHSTLFSRAKFQVFTRNWWTGQVGIDAFAQPHNAGSDTAIPVTPSPAVAVAAAAATAVAGNAHFGDNKDAPNGVDGSGNDTGNNGSGSSASGSSNSTANNNGTALKSNSDTDIGLIRHQVSLLERSRYYTGLLTKMPVTTTATALLTQLYNREKSRTMMLREVNQGGLELLYQILLDGAKPEVRTVLDLVLDAAEKGRPIMFFCKAGKDRTGLIAMLLLSALGASEQQIVADYHRSDSYHKVALAGLENKAELAGLDRARFERAPAETMEVTLSYIKTKYGSVGEYLTAVGFGPDKQKRLRQLVLEKEDSKAAL